MNRKIHGIFVWQNFEEILTDSEKCGDEIQPFRIEFNTNISIFVEFIIQFSFLQSQIVHLFL